MAAPLRINTPCCAPRPLPTIKAVGVARPRAHGHATTSTEIVAASARVKFEACGSTQGSVPCAATRIPRRASPDPSHRAAVRMAMPITTGTKTAVTWSAKAWIGTRVPCACSTMRTICERNVSAPTLVAWMVSRPPWFTVAPITASPGPLSTGIDSPVAMDSSTVLSPLRMTPSVGILSPGRTNSVSPTRTCASGTRYSCPSTSTVACLAPSCRSLRMACDARPLALASI